MARPLLVVLAGCRLLGVDDTPCTPAAASADAGRSASFADLATY